MEDRVQRALRRYSESASNADRRRLADTLLEAEGVSRKALSTPVGSGLVALSRLGCLAVSAAYFFLTPSTGEATHRLIAFLALPVAVASFPNQFARASGRLALAVRVRRPSPPRLLLLAAWLLLLVPVILLGIRWLSERAA